MTTKCFCFHPVPEDLDPFVDITPTRTSEEFTERPSTIHRTSSSSVTVFVSVPTTGSVYKSPSTDISHLSTDHWTAHTESRSYKSISTDATHTQYSESDSVTPAPSTSSNPFQLSSFTASHTYPTSSGASAPFLKEGSTIEGEIECEPGFTWNPEKQLCLHMLARCPKNMYLSVALNKCLPKIGDKYNCPPGYEYRNDLNGCEGEQQLTYPLIFPLVMIHIRIKKYA